MSTMGTLFTLLAIAAMIGVSVVLIQLANARHTLLPTATQPHRWHLPRRRPTTEQTHRRP
ncbi:hypothetical protein [Streptacidiphilus fuscans]|uniref:Uncharacterized protein n=1 Tax=Streptacidiphilus fuscans TaxID=2789292 RepID=A0A931B0R8_9ACTN|nr:hypothetical protein [Streptacidiphilus fuscans]MBF9066567.1 hypothetical protein [Streptacidiphilus fuscans]